MMNDAMEQQEPPNQAVLFELMQVLRQASAEIQSEQRLDDDLEVADSVRYEQGLICWQDRLMLNAPLTVQIHHAGLQFIRGELSHFSKQALILKSDRFEYLINTESVVVISGLEQRVSISKPISTDDYLQKIWLHDIVDRQLEATWFISNDTQIDGRCLRTWLDAVDVANVHSDLTIPLNHLVAVRCLR